MSELSRARRDRPKKKRPGFSSLLARYAAKKLKEREERKTEEDKARRREAAEQEARMEAAREAKRKSDLEMSNRRIMQRQGLVDEQGRRIR